jgi:FkbM family methyltransferase
LESNVNIVRRIAEIVLGDITVRRQLPRSVGSGTVVANAKLAGLRYLLRSSRTLDPVLISVTEGLVTRGDIVWDVGGNVGLFAVAAAGVAGREGRVFTFEADEDAFLLLRETARIQPKTHAIIEPICVAISNLTTIARFNIAIRCRSANAIDGYGLTQMGGTENSRLVPATSLDILVTSLPTPQVVKIDVEGAEALVLSGALTLLSEVRPKLFIEVSDEHSKGVSHTLYSFGYRVFDGATSNEVAQGSGAPWDTIAIPEEQPLPAFLTRSLISR